jgi:hypothetical protein
MPLRRVIWCVAEVKSRCGDHAVWEFGGVFSAREAAAAACLTERHYFWPGFLDEAAPSETVTEDHPLFPGAAWPKRHGVNRPNDPRMVAAWWGWEGMEGSDHAA